MKNVAVLSALVAIAAAAPQGVTSIITPTAAAPAGCTGTFNGEFDLVVETLASKKRDLLNKRTTLECTLVDGVLKDEDGRTGYIASNDQFQFDKPVQDGAIYTAGWTICANDSLALGGSTVFYECLSGTFYNLYDEDVAAQCTAIELVAVPVATGSATATATTTASGAASAQTDGQVTAGTPITTSVLCQITDGQVQADTCLATVTPITQITDGQIQAPATVTGATISQITDGQIQATATTSKAVTGATVSQITDGQIQATSATAVASSGSNSTIASTTRTPTASTTSAVATANAGAFNGVRSELFGLAAGLVALAAL